MRAVKPRACGRVSAARTAGREKGGGRPGRGPAWLPGWCGPRAVLTGPGAPGGRAVHPGIPPTLGGGGVRPRLSTIEEMPTREGPAWPRRTRREASAPARSGSCAHAGAVSAGKAPTGCSSSCQGKSSRQTGPVAVDSGWEQTRKPPVLVPSPAWPRLREARPIERGSAPSRRCGDGDHRPLLPSHPHSALLRQRPVGGPPLPARIPERGAPARGPHAKGLARCLEQAQPPTLATWEVSPAWFSRRGGLQNTHKTRPYFLGFVR